MPLARHSTQLLLFVALAISTGACRTKGSDIAADDFIAAIRPLPTADDSLFDPGTLRGKPTLLVFASPTCGHCMVELPLAQKAAAAENANMVAVFIVGNKKHASSVAKSKGLTGPVLVDEDGALRKKYNIKGVPYTIVLGTDGRGREAYRGEQGEETLREALADAR
jgi:thiol-disulfide isomerase/thioredoxin